MCDLDLDANAAQRLSRWLAEKAHLPNARPGTLLAGGNANVTRLVESDAGRFIMRQAPKQTVSSKASAGIEREYRLLQAVHGLAPVPRPVAWCNDLDVVGAPFAITEFVEGMAISEALPPAYGSDAAVVDAIGEALIDSIAQVHGIDWSARLPSDFGRPAGFLQRQISRWRAIRAQDTVRELPALEEIAEWLTATTPTDGASRIVHCDYHLDNCLFARNAPSLNAIIDWEMATIGDPMIDVGLLLMFWRRDEVRSVGFSFVQRVTNRPDVVDPRVLADRWSARTGISSERLDWYRVFAFWRLAAIVEGAYALYRRGEVDTSYARGLERDVPALLAEASALIG